MVRICWDIKILLNWKIEKLHEGWMILLLFVTLCALKFPSNLSQAPNPKHWHLCCWHILLDVKIDLVPNLHSVAKSAGSWVQEKIERDTAALNLHSSYWRNATGPLEQYHNERPPAPETKTFQGWHGHRSYIKLYRVKHGTSQTSHLQPPGPGRPSWSCCGMSEFLIQEKNDRNPWDI